MAKLALINREEKRRKMVEKYAAKRAELKELAAVGIKPILLMVGETVFLAVLVLLVLHWGF